MKAQIGIILITLLFLEPRGKIGVNGQRNAPVALPLGETPSLLEEAGWPQRLV